MRNARPGRSAHPRPGRWIAELPAVAVVALASAALPVTLIWAWWAPLALIGLGVGTVVTLRWISWVARRQARALLALWLVFALSRPLSLLVPASLAPVAQRIDDLALGLALVVIVLTGRLRFGLPAGGAGFYAGMVVFASSGVLSALLSGSSLEALFLGTWLGLKFLVAFFVSAQFTWSPAEVRQAFRVAAWLIVIVVLVAFVQLVDPASVNAVFGATVRERLGGRVITSVFREPAQYSAFSLLALVLVLVRHPLSRVRALAAVVVGVAALLSLRLKAMVDVVLVVVARVATSPVTLVRAGAPLVAVVLSLAAVSLGSGLISARLGVLVGDESSSPRQVLYSVATDIAESRAPLGAGFGSYGSQASIVYYSRLYQQYGLSETYGFSSEVPSYIQDASWATVLGETGWIGAVGVAGALGALVIALYRRLRTLPSGYRQDGARAALLFALVIVSDSVTSPQLFAGFYVLSLGILCSIAFSPEHPSVERTEGGHADETDPDPLRRVRGHPTAVPHGGQR